MLDGALLTSLSLVRQFPLPTSTSIGAIEEDMLDGAMLTSLSLVRQFPITNQYKYRSNRRRYA